MKKKQDAQRMMAFHLYEAVQSFVKECKRIDLLIPSESSRYSLEEMDEEARAIIDARKRDLLSYIQTICRDHIHWGEKLLKTGWMPQHEKEWESKRKRRHP